MTLDVGQVADDHVAERDVLLDDRVLLLGQRPGLAQDLVGDADLADVVEEPGDPDRDDHLREPGRAARPGRSP